jgi:hypothetical protein
MHGMKIKISVSTVVVLIFVEPEEHYRVSQLLLCLTWKYFISRFSVYQKTFSQAAKSLIAVGSISHSCVLNALLGL